MSVVFELLESFCVFVIVMKYFYLALIYIKPYLDRTSFLNDV